MEETIVDQDLFECVIKINAVKSVPNYSMPWKLYAPYQSYSSGFIIGNDRILCTAHGVVYGDSLLVSKHGNPKKYNAKVSHISNDVDLAILTVESKDFWDKVQLNRKYKLLEFEDRIPQLQDTICVLGYPLGGANLCITKGVVSRVSHSSYAQSGLSNLVTQIDAAINGGASGGPAIIDNKVVGMAFQGISNAQNVGYCVPVPVIKWFLNGIDKYNGIVPRVPTVGFSYQKCENEAMQRKLRMIISDARDKERIKYQEEEKKSNEKEKQIKNQQNETNETNNEKNEKNEKNETKIETTTTKTETIETTEKDKNIEKSGQKKRDSKTLLSDVNTTTSTTATTTTANTSDTTSEETDVKTSDTISTKISTNTVNDSTEMKTTDTTITTTATTTTTTISANDMTDKEGVYIARIYPLSYTKDVLRVGDILLSLNNIPIANDGTVPFRFSERISFEYLVRQYYAEDVVTLRVLRNGDIIELDLRLSSPSSCTLIPYHSYDVPKGFLTYFIFGGIVFAPLSKFLLYDKYGSKWYQHSPQELLNIYYNNNIIEYENEEIVLLAHILPHKTTYGYETSLKDCCIIKKCNDIEIKNVAHLSVVIDGLVSDYENDNKECEQFVRLEVSPHNICVLDLAEARDALSQVLKEQCIECDRSDNLKNLNRNDFNFAKSVDKDKDADKKENKKDGDDK